MQPKPINPLHIMKHLILFLLTVMASLAILPSCSDSEPERMTPCEIHFSLGPDIELHGVVSFDSILSAPSIIIEAADAKKAWPEISDSISGMSLYPCQSCFFEDESNTVTLQCFFEDESNAVTLQYGDHVKLKIGKIYSVIGGTNSYPYLSVDLLYVHKD